MEPTQITYDLFKTAEGQNAVVFALFGSAAHQAQHFEAALAQLLSEYNRIAKKGLTLEELESFDEKLSKQTMGMLLRDFRKYVRTDDPDVDRLLQDALEKRNFLMHRYWREREAGLAEEGSRKEMIEELVAIGHLHEKAAVLIRAMGFALSRTLSESKGSEESEEPALFSIEVELPDEKA